MFDSPNTSPLLKQASNALMVSKKPAKVTLPPLPAFATAAGMNFSHKASVSRRDKPAVEERTEWSRGTSITHSPRRQYQSANGCSKIIKYAVKVEWFITLAHVIGSM